MMKKFNPLRCYSFAWKTIHLVGIGVLILTFIIGLLCCSFSHPIDVDFFGPELARQEKERKEEREFEKEKEEHERGQEEEDEERDEPFAFPIELRQKIWEREHAKAEAEKEAAKEAEKEFLKFGGRNEFDSADQKPTGDYERNNAD